MSMMEIEMAANPLIEWVLSMESPTPDEEEQEQLELSFTQWSKTTDGSAYTPVGQTVGILKPGYYDIATEGGHLFFARVRERNDNLLEFPDSMSKRIVESIQDFWGREDNFRRYGLQYKRGILLYGPPGSGKSCTLQLVARDVVKRGGIVLNYNPRCFTSCYRALRDIQPTTPVVVTMEDFESALSAGYETYILNLLDGLEHLDRIVFLATTNYPERLPPRITNRPSRFDLVVKIDHPGQESRALYVRSMMKEGDSVDVAKYARDTDGLSLAHLKELFVATVVLGADYTDTLRRLKGMGLQQSSFEDHDVPTGLML